MSRWMCWMLVTLISVGCSQQNGLQTDPPIPTAPASQGASGGKPWANAPADRKAELDAAVEDVDFEANNYFVELETSKGTITLELTPEKAPLHCLNIIGLTRIGFYDGLIFHRVIPGFMIQGGCPQGTGMGDAGYEVPAEFNDTPHVAGVLSAARSNDPNSAGSQFFVCVDTASYLDGEYTAYGRTVDDESLAVAVEISKVQRDANDRPLTPVEIKSAKVIVKPKT